MGATHQDRPVVILYASRTGEGTPEPADHHLAEELAEEHHLILRDCLPMFGGKEAASLGDDLVAVFNDPLAAVQCALEFQRTLAERNEKRAEERQIRSRLGIQSGAVESPGGGRPAGLDHVARLVARAAEPGGICLSRPIFAQVGQQLPHRFIRLDKPGGAPKAGVDEVYRLLPEATPEMLGAAKASRKQLFWLVLGIVVLNVVLFLKFGVDRKARLAPGKSQTNQPAASPGTNAR